ncbi:GNAT family N-acetyltransferase [Phaeodactylibacter luteus]|uniref:GNAT family N-acetyltransferase n=1 Tax=Phaeodactylibacter luteus TaxID=1564516 RepID=UPI001B87AB71|nr:GNAT family N-acetyltransferase [Phaeodactylibacter luteus]
MKKGIIKIQSSRLVLRELCPQDAPWFKALNDDPEVVRYTGDGPFRGLPAARAFLEAYPAEAYLRYGMGRWAVCLRTGHQEPLGWCGLKWHPATREADLGFRLFRRYWGQGFATEAAAACLAYGRGELGLARIIGRAMAANRASVRVLEKLGFVQERQIVFEGQPGLLYRFEDGLP